MSECPKCKNKLLTVSSFPVFVGFINDEFNAIKEKLKKSKLLGEDINLYDLREIVVGAYYLKEREILEKEIKISKLDANGDKI